jgi:hypothetical protein
MEVATMSANKWAEIIANTQVGNPDVVPDDFKTSKDLSTELNIPCRTLRAKLEFLIKAGKVERKNFRINHPLKGLHSTPHYKIIT